MTAKTAATPTDRLFARLERATTKVDTADDRLVAAYQRRNNAIHRLKALGMPTSKIADELGLKVAQTVANVLAVPPTDRLEGLGLGAALKQALAAQVAMVKAGQEKDRASTERDEVFYELFAAGVQQIQVAAAAGVTSNIVRKGRERHAERLAEKEVDQPDP